MLESQRPDADSFESQITRLTPIFADSDLPEIPYSVAEIQGHVLYPQQLHWDLHRVVDELVETATNFSFSTAESVQDKKKLHQLLTQKVGEFLIRASIKHVGRTGTIDSIVGYLIDLVKKNDVPTRLEDFLEELQKGVWPERMERDPYLREKTQYGCYDTTLPLDVSLENIAEEANVLTSIYEYQTTSLKKTYPVILKLYQFLFDESYQKSISAQGVFSQEVQNKIAKLLQYVHDRPKFSLWLSNHGHQSELVQATYLLPFINKPSGIELFTAEKDHTFSFVNSKGAVFTAPYFKSGNFLDPEAVKYMLLKVIQKDTVHTQGIPASIGDFNYNPKKNAQLKQAKELEHLGQLDASTDMILALADCDFSINSGRAAPTGMNPYSNSHRMANLGQGTVNYILQSVEGKSSLSMRCPHLVIDGEQLNTLSIQTAEQVELGKKYRPASPKSGSDFVQRSFTYDQDATETELHPHEHLSVFDFSPNLVKSPKDLNKVYRRRVIKVLYERKHAMDKEVMAFAAGKHASEIRKLRKAFDTQLFRWSTRFFQKELHVRLTAVKQKMTESDSYAKNKITTEIHQRLMYQEAQIKQQLFVEIEKKVRAKQAECALVYKRMSPHLQEMEEQEEKKKGLYGERASSISNSKFDLEIQKIKNKIDPDVQILKDIVLTLLNEDHLPEREYDEMGIYMTSTAIATIGSLFDAFQSEGVEPLVQLIVDDPSYRLSYVTVAGLRRLESAYGSFSQLGNITDRDEPVVAEEVIAVWQTLVRAMYEVGINIRGEISKARTRITGVSVLTAGTDYTREILLRMLTKIFIPEVQKVYLTDYLFSSVKQSHAEGLFTTVLPQSVSRAIGMNSSRMTYRQKVTDKTTKQAEVLRGGRPELTKNEAYEEIFQENADQMHNSIEFAFIIMHLDPQKIERYVIGWNRLDKMVGKQFYGNFLNYLIDQVKKEVG